MNRQQTGNETTRADATLPDSSALFSAFAAGDTLAGRFRILRKLGEGGMAVVYEALDEKLGERRALKFAKGGFSGLIPPEALSAMRVTHDNICRTYEIHTATIGKPAVDFISMEYVEGETLQSRCQRERLSQAELIEIAQQICQGLEAAHRAQILHRDLKGNNIMLTRRSDGSVRAVIMDFGLAKFVTEGAVPATSAFVGTPNYVAPERWKDAVATPASDVYALGVVLYEMLTGRLPFDPQVPLKTRLASLPDPPSTRQSGIDSHWDDIVLDCLQPDPQKRISSPGEVRQRIENIFAVSHRRRWIAAFAALLLTAFSGYYFRDTLFPPPPLARLAILPFKADAPAPETALSTAVRGGLSDIAARLDVLGNASHRLVIISPEEVQSYRVDSPEMAATRLRATHALSGEIESRGGLAQLHATITELKTGNVLQRFDGEFRPADLAAISTSLAGVVTSAFHLGGAPPASISKDAYSEYAQGLALLRRDSLGYDQALEHFGAAQTIDPQSSLVFAGQAEALLGKFRVTRDSRWLQEAATVAERAQSLHPDSVPVLLILGSIQQSEGKAEGAISRLQRAAELEPNNSDVWRRMGTAFDSAGRTEEAIGAFRKSIQLAPDYFRPHRDLGTFLGRRGQFNEAIEEYRLVTKLAPELAEGYSDLGGVLIAAEREDEAEVALRRSIQLRETRAALNNLGVLLRFKKRDAEAVPVLKRGLAAGADDATIRLNLANALRRTGHADEAREHYKRANELARAALLLNPRDGASRARLAYSMVQLGMTNLAADEALQAVRLAPSDYYTLFWTIMTLDAMSRRADAYPLLAHASPQQLKDLRRQPDLADFINDPRFSERTSNGRN